MPLPTLLLDELSIAGTIDIMETHLRRLGLEEVAVRDKKIMFRGYYLTARHVTKAI